MKKILLFILVVAFMAYMYLQFKMPDPAATNPTATSTVQAMSIVASGLSIPWDIAFLPDGDLLVTERTGDVLLINPETHSKTVVFTVDSGRGEGGLLGIVLHPDFARNHYIYLYMSTAGASGETDNKVIRYTYAENTITSAEVVISGIPGAIYHDGGRMEFGPDGMLYITTGDATRSKIAQDKNSLGGKILRVNDDGTIPIDNPFSTMVYSYGHRNPQGLAWDSVGRLWETEHGRSGVTTGMDELNLIEKGANYGWPDIEGDATKAGMITPAINSGPDDTWAPASLAYLNGSLFYGGLRGEALYEAVLSGDTVTNLKEHFKGEFGRIRTVRVGPDSMLYITTSNRDGRGTPAEGDDKIIRIDPRSLD